MTAAVPRLYEVIDGKMTVNFHEGQLRAWDSEKRFVDVLAGAQSGKTEFGPLWLHREIQRKGPGDYLVVTPTYPLLVKKALPTLLKLFKRFLRLGEYQTQQKIFTFSEHGARKMFGERHDDLTPTQIFFGHATDPESLESATAKAAWLDEVGQKKFRHGSWEAIQRRLAVHQGRALLTTTPYDLGWMKQLLYDPWMASKQNHPLIDVIRFDSTANPAFPQEEFERLRNSMPLWRFNLFHRGIYTRPAGLIYSSFNETLHKIPRFTIPEWWPRFIGLDFGGVNTAAVYVAQEMKNTQDATGRYIMYREYKAGERSAAEHCLRLMGKDGKNEAEPRIPLCVGGSKSEGQWRREFAAGGTVDGVRVTGLPIHGPKVAPRQGIESIVEVGINKVFGTFARGQLLVFDDLHGVLDELGSYSRELDEMGEPTEKIDAKETFHYCDAIRYLIGHLQPDKPETTAGGFVARKGLQNL